MHGHESATPRAGNISFNLFFPVVWYALASVLCVYEACCCLLARNSGLKSLWFWLGLSI